MRSIVKVIHIPVTDCDDGYVIVNGRPFCIHSYEEISPWDGSWWQETCVIPCKFSDIDYFIDAQPDMKWYLYEGSGTDAYGKVVGVEFATAQILYSYCHDSSKPWDSAVVPYAKLTEITSLDMYEEMCPERFGR